MAGTPEPKVCFPNGATLVGSTVYGLEKKRPVSRFLGVPYAKAPERFQPAGTLELWTGERKATEFGAICPQDTAHYVRMPLPADIPNNHSEDCLFLNIWTPKLAPDAKLPVMVWIHGGSFLFGFSNMYQGTGMCSYQDVVFVSINYRLGPFGFMTTGDDVAPGNYGIMDQIEALRWVQKYIPLFGGDPENVTVFGESAGGMSASMLLSSEMARGLFKRAISQSGTANSPSFLFTQEYVAGCVRKQLKDTAQASASSRDLINYLKSLPAAELVSRLGDQFRPVVDGSVLKGFPGQQYEAGAVTPAEYMLGCNTHETYTFLATTISQMGGGVNDRAKIAPLLDFITGILGGAESPEQLKEAMFQEYFKGVPDGDDTQFLQGLQRLFCDVVFVAPMAETANNHSKIAPTFVYKFMYRPSFCKHPAWVVADHYMEILYALGMPLSDSKLITFNKEEVKLSKLMTAYWANFARTGNPNGEGLPNWPSFNEEDHEYMVLNAHPAATKAMRANQTAFWREQAAKYIQSKK